MKKIINLCLILIIIPILMGAKWSEKYPIVGKDFTCEYTTKSADFLKSFKIKVTSDGIYAVYPDNSEYRIESNSGSDIPHYYNNKSFYFSSSFDTEYFLKEYKENNGCMRNIYLAIDGEHITTNCPTGDCPTFTVKKNASSSNNGDNTGKLDGYEDSDYDCYQPNATSCKTYHVDVSDIRTVYVELGFYKPSNSDTYERYFVVSYLHDLDDGKQAKLNETMAATYQNYVYEIINPDLIFSYSNGKYNYIAESDFDITYDPTSTHYYIINKKLDDSIYSNYISVGQNIGTYDPSVYGKDNNIEEDLEIKPITFCEENRVLKVFQILGYVIFGAKVVVPLILLILGTIDFAKAVISSSEKAPQEALKSFGLRIVAAIIVFLIPTFLEFLISLVNEASETFKEKNENCTNCLFNPFNPDECKASNVDYDNAD